MGRRVLAPTGRVIFFWPSQFLALLNRILHNQDLIMKSQADLQASVTALEAAVAALSPVAPLDLSAEVARIDAVTAAVKAFETPVAVAPAA